jgi:hypothetical protein
MNINELKEIEFGVVRTLQGGRIDRTSDSVLTWAPDAHGSVGLFTGSVWSVITKSSSVSYNISDKDYFGNNITAGLNYDVFASYVSGGDFLLKLVPWATDNTRVADLYRFEGVLVYENSSAGLKMRYLGSVRLIAGPAFVDSTTQRFVVNWENRQSKTVRCYCSSSGSWTSSSVNIVEFYTGTNMVRGEFLSLTTDQTLIGVATSYFNALSGASARAQIGVGFNSVTSSNCWAEYYQMASALYFNGVSVTTHGTTTPLLGYNYMTVLFRAITANTFSMEAGAGDYTGGVLYVMA